MKTQGTALATSNESGREPALKHVHANGVRFAYLEQGRGPLVMFLHGFPDNAWSYRKQLQVFADAGYRAVSPFLRGYAPTEIPADGIFGPVAERAVRRFQRRHGLVPDGIVGPLTRAALGLRPFTARSVRRTSSVQLPLALRRIAECESGGNPRAVSPGFSL